MKDVAIIGGGISGLSLAHFLKKRGVAFDLFERENRFGGMIGSVFTNGFAIERGANSLLDSQPEVKELLRDLGLQSRLVRANPSSKNRYVWRADGLHRLPKNPLEFFLARNLSLRTKIQTLRGIFGLTRRAGESESVYNFFERIFGGEIAEHIAVPMTLGIYGGDARQLIMGHTFPKLASLEKQHGSLIKGMVLKRGQAGSLFTLPGGTQEIIESLKKTVGDHIYLNQSVETIESHPPGNWKIHGKEYSCAVLCGDLETVRTLFPRETGKFPMAIDSAPLVSLSIELEKPNPIEGFGILIHPESRKKTLGILSPTEIFPHSQMAPGRILTFILGGIFDAKVVGLPDDHLLRTVLSEGADIFGHPLEIRNSWIFRYPLGIPQPTAQTVKNVDTIKSSLEAHKGLFLNSSLSGGASVPDRICQSWSLAKKIKDLLPTF